MSKPRSELTIQISEDRYNRLTRLGESLHLSAQDYVVKLLDYLVEGSTQREDLDRLFSTVGPNVGKVGQPQREHEGKELLVWAMSRQSQLTFDLERAKDLLWHRSEVVEDIEHVLAFAQTVRKPLRNLVSSVCKK